MGSKIGKNTNTVDTVATTTVAVNSVTATTLLAANPDRLWARITLDSGSTDAEVFIRDYAAVTDNIKKGELLVRLLSGNDSIYKAMYSNPGPTEVTYTGEISAITVAGTFNVHIMEAVK